MTSSLDMIRGRSNVVTLTNNSGGALVAGDVCIQDTSADEKVTTTTSAASVLKVFVAAETIASGAAGRFYESGYCPLVNVNASVTRGRFLFTHTVAKQAAENATYGAGAFGKILKSGTTPSAIIYSATAQTSGGAGSDTTAIHTNVSAEINGITSKATPVSGDLLLIEDSAASNAKKKITVGSIATGTGTDPNHAFYTYLAAGLEPLAIEAAQVSTFSYAVNSSTTKLVIASFNTRLGSGGLWEVRDPRRPVPIRDVTLTGLSSISTGVILDPSLPTYTNARTTYFDRLNTLATTSLRYLAVTAAAQAQMFLPGPYGSIITNIAFQWTTWLILRVYGASLGWNLSNEIGNTGATDYQNVSNALYLPVSKNVACVLESGANGGGTSLGGITYIHCPSSWGKVTDPNTYDFRDDFMGASLDTSTVWTRSSGGGGQVEIDTQHQWLKMKGDGNWGNNGAHSQASISRAAGKVFMCDVYMDAVDAGGNAIVIGFHDGSGQSYTDFAHGIIVSSASLTVGVYENGNSRGNVGSGLSVRTIYRFRITLGTNAATYEVQGGTQYAALGGASWTNITPGTSSSSTTPLYAGVTMQTTGNFVWIGDVKIY